MTVTQRDIQELTANTIRGLAMDGVQAANSGHPGMPMGMADVATVLWTRHLRYSIEDPGWPGRDRFVLSAGHGSMLQYAMLHLAGFDLPMEELQNFRQLHSKTPGHPEVGQTVGVEITTGPLGSGFASGIGMALGARMEACRFANPQFENRVVGIVSDGDLMEGVANEAASVAGHLGLSNVIYFYDDNQITIEGSTSLAFSEDVEGRFTALGWRVLQTDGHDHAQIAEVMADAFTPDDRPTLVICKTHIGFGSPTKQDTAGVHGAPLGEEELVATKAALGLPDQPFHVPDDVRAVFAERALANESYRQEWLAAVQATEAANPERAAEHLAFRERRIPDNLLDELVAAGGTDKAATRALSSKVIQRAAELVPSLVGGSADLEPSCKTSIKASTSITRQDFSGRNLHFGVREHAMGAILNGLALHGGFLPIGSTFLVFTDYMRPSLRLCAIMKLPVGFIYTHDSLMVGEDGPTHQPVEQVTAIRIIPNIHVWRPADGAEVGAAWHATLTRRDGPTAMCLTRQSQPSIERPASITNADLASGGYLVHDDPAAVATLIATGSEVAIAVEAAATLAADGKPIRVVSMPCIERFLANDNTYRQGVLGDLPTFAVEMGRPEIWCQFTGHLDRVFGLSTFGLSGPASDVAQHFGFTGPQLATKLGKRL
ncbi:MAG: transketolase [Planctomycetota bacterium]|nr:transketolase [Planctomycetota bacterium]